MAESEPRPLSFGDALESGECLVAVWAVVDPDLPAELRGLVLGFERRGYWVAVSEDDEIMVSEEPPSEGGECGKVDLSADEPWRGLLGRRLRWVWQLVNQQGYADGLQFEWAPDHSRAGKTLQLVAVAGRLAVARVLELGIVLPDTGAVGP